MKKYLVFIALAIMATVSNVNAQNWKDEIPESWITHVVQAAEDSNRVVEFYSSQNDQHPCKVLKQPGQEEILEEIFHLGEQGQVYVYVKSDVNHLVLHATNLNKKEYYISLHLVTHDSKKRVTFVYEVNKTNMVKEHVSKRMIKFEYDDHGGAFVRRYDPDFEMRDKEGILIANMRLFDVNYYEFIKSSVFQSGSVLMTTESGRLINIQ